MMMKGHEDFDPLLRYETRRTGDGQFYIVSIDAKGTSECVYVNGKLKTFESSTDARAYRERVSTLNARR
jgi:hypothetical protein